MADFRGEYVMMMDSLVNPAVRPICREASGIDFDNLEGQWVSIESFNKYIEKLRERAGDQGPYIVGTRTIGVAAEMFGAYEGIDDLGQAAQITIGMYDQSTRGDDKGHIKVLEISDNKIVLESTSKLDGGYGSAVFAGLIRMYTNRIAKTEITENLDEHGRYVFEYNW